ncbi:hypothetical protein [Streptomyces sp. NBC_00078]|uniref:hypothetical protein n=1 Tax=unclassified Streptomyces TaxID=2593676 RepID=UPI0022581E1D|nr:hypothetical protein [Streptomyces sp. NBC_00078]MCX5421177.1 hypothetical protein [Streptomyces sp. NBC_00078]
MRYVKNVLATTCAAVSLLALSSCAGSGDDPAPAPQASGPTGHAQPSPGIEANPLPLPVQKYLLTPSKISGIRSATNILVNACLRQRNVPPIKQTTSEASQQNNPDPYEVGRRYGPIVKSDILTYGYHLPPAWFGSATASPKVSAQQEAAMNGPSGCLAVSRGELIGDRSLDSPVARQISSKSFMESLKDPKVKAVIADWSSCMAKKGYSYTGPLQALSKADLRSSKPGVKELRDAAADYSCKVSTHLISTWQAVETRIQDKEIAKHLSALKKANAQRAQIMAKADKIVRQGG